MKEEFINIPGFDSDLPLSVALAGTSYCDGAYRIHRKKSNVHVLEYILKGQGTVSVRGETHLATAGDVYFLHEGEEHIYASSSTDPWVKLWVNLRGPLVDALVDSYGIRSHTVISFPAEAYLRRMHELLSAQDVPSEVMMHRVSLVLHELIQRLSSCVHATQDASEDALHMKQFLDAHVYDGITTEAAAAHICKSEAQAIRIFKRAYGATPYEYYLTLRMKKASSLLESTQLSVKEVAYRLNFCDEHYFSNLFKRKMGISPRDVKRKKAKSEEKL